MIKYYQTERSDEPELRRLLRNTPMEGLIEVSFQAEPDFFKAIQVQGRFVQTLGMRDLQKDSLVGMGTRAVKPCYVNGNLTDVGYLSGLRGNVEYRNSFGLIRGYRLFKELHEDNRAKLYISTIIEDNTTARKILESGRCGMPNYNDIGRFCTYALSLKKSKKNNSKSIQIRHAQSDDIPGLVHFLNSEGPNKQFYPCYCHEDFTKQSGLLNGLKLNDIYLAFDSDELVGVTAAWDQRTFKQSVVKGYRKPVNKFRTISNIGLNLLGFPMLPKPGTPLNYFSISLICVKNNNIDIFSLLLNSIILERKEEYAFMMAGFHEKDQLLTVLKQLKGISYSSRLYVVCWPDGDKDYHQLDNRTPYLELGAL